MSEETIWVVAPNVTIYVNDSIVFYAGDEVTPGDFESAVEFREQVAAGRIIGKQPEPPAPEPEKRWDMYSIDEELDADSPNPVSNRALTRVIGDIGKVTVDGELSETSENPVQNKAITRAMLRREDSLTDEQISALKGMLGQ